MENEEKQPQEAETPENQPEEAKEAEKVEEKDLSAEVAKYKAIAERQSKKLEKLKSSLEDKADDADSKDDTNKTKTQKGLTKEEAIFFAKGGTEEEFEMLQSIEGKTLKDKQENPMYKAWKEAKELEVKSQKAQLGASKGGGTILPKPVEEMSKEEHQAAINKMIADAG